MIDSEANADWSNLLVRSVRLVQVFLNTHLHYLPSSLDQSAVNQFFRPIFVDQSSFRPICLLPWVSETYQLEMRSRCFFSERVIALSHAATANHCSVIIFAAFKWFRRKKKLPYFSAQDEASKISEKCSLAGNLDETWEQKNSSASNPKNISSLYLRKKEEFFFVQDNDEFKFCSLFASELKAQVLFSPYPCARLY